MAKKTSRSFVLAAVACMALTGCNKTTSTATSTGTSTGGSTATSTASTSTAPATGVQAVINQAHTMDWTDVYKKAMDEIDGQKMYATGNSSRGGTALERFLHCLQGQEPNGTSTDGKTLLWKDKTDYAVFKTYKPNFTFTYDWSDKTGGTIYDYVDGDITGAKNLDMCMIQNASDLQSKEIETGNLLNYVPKEYVNTADPTNVSPLGMENVAKVFMYNNKGTKKFSNMWDTVGDGIHPQVMDITNETVGRNFLVMLTNETYSAKVKAAYDALTDKTYADTAIKYITDNNIATKYGITGDNAKYALAWDYLFLKQYTHMSDDGDTVANLAAAANTDQLGLLVYSKLRKIKETTGVSVANVDLQAYNSDFAGIGGYSYKHYLQVFKTAPHPWTACALIHYMSCNKDGFYAWGKDLGSYPTNESTGVDHTKDGQNIKGADGNLLPDVKTCDDKGWSWWKDKLVQEDPVYASKHAKLTVWFTSVTNG
ncbi:MAG: hypothetical protein LKM30_00270 [Bacilli bacterium]|jgi:hypothetical protein|nr:hypothetical protein [Bacilli bacterium]